MILSWMIWCVVQVAWRVRRLAQAILWWLATFFCVVKIVVRETILAWSQYRQVQRVLSSLPPPSKFDLCPNCKRESLVPDNLTATLFCVYCNWRES